MAETNRITIKTTELDDGQMKPLTIGDTKVLLVRLKGKFYAVGATCPHYGAPMEKGLLCGDRLLCPWHKSCFSATTGDLLEPPALDGLPQFDVQVNGDDVLISLPAGDRPDAQLPELVTANPQADSRVFVILGAGAAGCFAAQTLRQIGFQGRIILIGLENRIPYDRPSLSKQYMAGKKSADAMPLRSLDFYHDYQIEQWQRRVVTVDAMPKRITFADGSSLQYDALLLATGGQPRSLDVPGSDLDNIFLLRTYEDADRILAAVHPGARVVVVGDSFIGMETAASLTQRQCPVTIVAPGSTPFEKVLGSAIGAMLQHQHEQQGIQFRLGTKVSKFQGNGRVQRVGLANGEELKADLVVVGIGVRPATDYLKGVDLHPDGGVPVNSYLQAADGLYAAGDIAVFPEPRLGQSVRIEHWRLAEQHGRVAAYNMAGQPTKFDRVPFFWTNQFSLRVDYVGHAEEWDEIVVDGDISKPEFVAYYIKGDRVLAAAGCKRDRQICEVHELMQQDILKEADKKLEQNLGLPQWDTLIQSATETIPSQRSLNRR